MLMLYGSVDDFGCLWLSIHKTSHIPMVQISIYFKMRGEPWCVATFSFCLWLASTEGWRHLLVKSRAETESLIHVRLCRHCLKFLPGEVQLLPTQIWNCDCWFVPCKPPSALKLNCHQTSCARLSHLGGMESLTSFASAFIGNESGISARGGPLTPALVWPLIATHSVLCLSVVSPCRRIEYSQSSGLLLYIRECQRSVHGVSELIIVTSFPNATGHTPLASFSRLRLNLR